MVKRRAFGIKPADEKDLALYPAMYNASICAFLGHFQFRQNYYENLSSTHDTVTQLLLVLTGHEFTDIIIWRCLNRLWISRCLVWYKYKIKMVIKLGEVIEMKYVTAIIFGLTLALSTQISSAQEKPPLTAPELTSLLSGNSMAGNGKINAPAAPYDWIAFYATDGTITMRLKPEWGGATDSGRWWITEKGELCRQFQKMATGKEGCWLFYREDEFYRFIPSQGVAMEGRTTIIQGNLLQKTD